MELSLGKSLKFPRVVKGYYLIILSALLAALVHVIAKPLLETTNVEGLGVSPVVLAATIYFINGLFFTPLSKNSVPIHKIKSRSLILMVLIGIVEVSALITYFFGLKESTAINASIFSNGEIIFSLIIAMTIFRERLKKSELTPFFMIIFGMMILPVVYDFYQHGMSMANLVLGDMLIILSGFFYAIDINMCKYVSKKYDSKRITQLVSFVSCGFAVSLLLIFQIPFDITTAQIPTVVILAIIGTGIPTLFFLISLRIIGAVRTILLYSTTSIFGIVFSTIILSEQITILNIVSVATVMAGIYLLRNRLGEDDESRQIQHLEN